jgi:hypothetical protein
MTVLTDLGIHRTKEDQQEAELKEAGWVPTALHPRSKTWWSPERVLFPGPTYAWLVMKGLVKYKV